MFGYHTAFYLNKKVLKNTLKKHNLNIFGGEFQTSIVPS